MRTICKSCENAHKTRWYERNRDYHKDKVNERRKKNKEECQAYIMMYFSTYPCEECGMSDHRVLEFHHIGTKKKTIGQLLAQGYTLKTIKKKMSQFQVLCTNCHRIKTAEEQDWYKNV